MSIRDIIKNKKSKIVSTEEALKNVEPFDLRNNRGDNMDMKDAILQQYDINEKLSHKETLLKGKEELIKNKDKKEDKAQ